MAHAWNGCSQSSRFLPQARRIVGSGDENGNVCVVFTRISAHAQKLILRGGERGIECCQLAEMRPRRKENRKPPWMPSLRTRSQTCLTFYQRSYILRWTASKQWGIDSSVLTCFFSSCSILWRLLDAICLSMTWQNLFMDTRRRLWKSAVEIASLTRGFKYKPCW